MRTIIDFAQDCGVLRRDGATPSGPAAGALVTDVEVDDPLIDV